MSIAKHPNVVAAHEDEPEDNVEVSENEQTIRDKIVHILSIYPKLSHSMLQVGIGTSMPPGIWKPVLLKMIGEGIIENTSRSTSTPTGRVQAYTILSLRSETQS